MTTFNVPEIIGKVKGESVGSYLETEHRNFAIYTLQQRAIPFFNGMKPVQQRCLWHPVYDIEQDSLQLYGYCNESESCCSDSNG